jgi:hypothetical protein
MGIQPLVSTLRERKDTVGQSCQREDGTTVVVGQSTEQSRTICSLQAVRDDLYNFCRSPYYAMARIPVAPLSSQSPPHTALTSEALGFANSIRSFLAHRDRPRQHSLRLYDIMRADRQELSAVKVHRFA